MKERILMIAGLMLLVTACTPAGKSIDTLPVDDVLARVALASNNLESVSLLAHGTLIVSKEETKEPLKKSVFSLEINRDRFMQLKASFIVDGQDYKKPFSAKGEVFVAPISEAYIRFDSISGKVFNLEKGKTGEWLLLDESKNQESDINGFDLIINPLIEAIEVTNDNNGVIKRDQSYFYHYDIKLSEQWLSALKEQNKEGELDLQMLSAKGQLWIDAQTFNIQKLVWDLLLPLSAEETQAHISLEVDFTNHNQVEEITPPAPEASRDNESNDIDLKRLIFFDVL